MYKDGLYRVTFSPEEKEYLTRKGWSEDPEPGAEYVVHTAVSVDQEPVKPVSPAVLAKAKDKAKVQDEAEAARKAAEAKTAAQNAPATPKW